MLVQVAYLSCVVSSSPDTVAFLRLERSRMRSGAGQDAHDPTRRARSAPCTIFESALLAEQHRRAAEGSVVRSRYSTFRLESRHGERSCRRALRFWL
jgi:hypothetical protein